MNNIPETPLRVGFAETGNNYRIVTTPAKAILCRNYRNLIGGVILLLSAFLVPLIVADILERWEITMPSKVTFAIGSIFAFGGICMLIIDFVVRRYARQYEFDIRERILRIHRRKSVESEISLANAKALQISCAYYISERVTRQRQYSKSHWWSYELNLVYDKDGSPERQNLICTAGRGGVLKPGNILADWLGVPLLDHATQEHRQKEKMERKSQETASPVMQ
jgi:hypothetical protein